MLRRLCLVAALLLGVFGSAAAEGGKTIIVLDASGSMWGQVEGEAKIAIAQRALLQLLETIPAEQELGLSAYGHRRKGDCADIETLVPPGPGTRDAIRQAVQAISPKGKTPLSAAVIAAAEELKYEEAAATVILLSDGIETCELDPCEVGRRLEESGVSFTAHVIGFDVAAEADREQLRCLAENTGGRFLTADNAEELAEALELASQAAPEPLPEPEPEPAALTASVTFQAVDGPGGPLIAEGLHWDLTGLTAGTVLATDQAGGALELALDPGGYRAEVRRPSDGAEAETTVEVVGGEPQVFTLVLEGPLPTATVSGPATAPAASTIAVAWSGPGEAEDYVSVARPDAADTRHESYINVSKGSPLALLLPPEPGEYELRYVLHRRDLALARQTIVVTPVTASLQAAATVPAGSALSVTWSGPGYADDYVSVSAADAGDGEYLHYSYVKLGSPLSLQMPAESGQYELRYVQRHGRKVLARLAIAVTAVEATLSAPDTAAAGATIEVGWSGPGYRNDYISVSAPDAREGDYISYSYVREADGVALLLPAEPGHYELRYVQQEGRKVLARRAIEVTSVSASLSAPATAPAGSTIAVDWQGPDYRNDFISVTAPDARDGDYINYIYTRLGHPAELLLPPEPGRYEIRYVQQQERLVLARLPIELTEVTASLAAPPNGKAGELLTVTWVGPDYRNDYIALSEVGSRDSDYVAYSYTKRGSPLELKLPKEPGTYELRYVMAQDKRVLVRQAFTVE